MGSGSCRNNQGIGLGHFNISHSDWSHCYYVVVRAPSPGVASSSIGGNNDGGKVTRWCNIRLFCQPI